MKNKVKILLSVIGVIVSVVLLVISALLAENQLVNPIGAFTLIVISVILVVASIFYAAKVDYENGIYVCRKCGNTFIPTFKEYIYGAHTIKTRYLKCPECNKSSWCIRKN